MECGGQAADAAGHERGARGRDEAPHPDPISAPQLRTDENSFYVADIYRVINELLISRACVQKAQVARPCACTQSFFFAGVLFFLYKNQFLITIKT